MSTSNASLDPISISTGIDLSVKTADELLGNAQQPATRTSKTPSERTQEEDRISSFEQFESALTLYHHGKSQEVGSNTDELPTSTTSSGSTKNNAFSIAATKGDNQRDRPELVLGRCNDWLRQLQPHDDENRIDEDRERNWKRLMTEILVPVQALTTPKANLREGTNPQLEEPSDPFAERKQRLRQIQIQALLRLTLWALHGNKFVKSYERYYRIQDPKGKKQKRKHRNMNTDHASVSQDDSCSVARQFLLQEVHKILSMAAFCLPQHESFSKFLNSILLKSLLNNPNLMLPKQNGIASSKTVISYLYDQFEIANPYAKYIKKDGGCDGWDKKKKKRRNSLTWMEPLPQSRPKKKKKTATGCALAGKAVPPPPQKKLLSMIGAKSRYRGSHFQSNLPSISRLLDQKPSQTSRNIAPPKTQLQIKPLLRRRASTGNSMASAPCLRPIRIHPIAATTTSNRNSMIPPLSPTDQRKPRSLSSLQHQQPAQYQRTDGDATPTRSNRRRAIHSDRASASVQPRMVVEETPSKKTPKQPGAGTAVSVPETPVATSTTAAKSPAAITASRHKVFDLPHGQVPETPIPPTPVDLTRGVTAASMYGSLTPQGSPKVSTADVVDSTGLRSPETPPPSRANPDKVKSRPTFRKRDRHGIVAQQLLFSPPPRRLSTGGINSRQI